MSDTSSFFADTIIKQKYAMTKPSGEKESWPEIAERVATAVTKPFLPEITNRIQECVTKKELLPGGRYLYCSGKPYQQLNNCALFDVDDSREGWADLMYNITSTLMVGAGVGVVYSKLRGEGVLINGMGGNSTGPLALMQMVNEAGRFIMQGGSRRSAIWSGLHWNHPDILKFLVLKDWPKHLRDQKLKDFNSPAPMDGTNISVILDDDFFTAYNDINHPQHYLATEVYWTTVKQMRSKAEPAFSVDVGKNAGEHLRNAPVAGGTMVLTLDDAGSYKKITINEIVDKPTTIWTGNQWAENVVFKLTKENTETLIIQHQDDSVVCDPNHEFLVIPEKPSFVPGVTPRIYATDRIAAKDLKIGDKLLVFNPDSDGYSEVVNITTGPIQNVYCADVGVPEHSFWANGVIVSNCTEVVSRDNGDVCNLSSINLARINNITQFAEIIYDTVGFMLCGTMCSKLPLQIMYKIREKNRRLGLGLMGMHEWLLKRGKKYGPDKELGEWLQVYKDVSDLAAKEWANKLGIATPIAARAIAPCGTISIVAETTGGIEPIMAVAIKRRYLKGRDWHYQYIIDAAAQRLIDQGVSPDVIEDAYDLAEDVERRIAFQAWAQSFLDNGVSSTINLPAWGSSTNNESTLKSFGNILMKYLPQLRGITTYPDGSRGGQPLTKVSYKTAVKHLGKEIQENGDTQDTVIFEETTNNNVCANGVCGI